MINSFALSFLLQAVNQLVIQANSQVIMKTVKAIVCSGVGMTSYFAHMILHKNIPDPSGQTLDFILKLEPIREMGKKIMPPKFYLDLRTDF